MRTTLLRVPAAAAALILAVPAAALAQRQLEPVRVTAVAQADSFEAAAASYRISRLKDFKKVARLYEASAELRGPEDAKRFNSLRMAAFLRYGAGDESRAAENMAQAAAHAAARGDVVNAATAYTDASLLAAQARRGNAAVEYADAARLLSESPLISDTQRSELRARTPRAVAAMAVPQLAAANK
jgi:hypothetical protein